MSVNVPAVEKTIAATTHGRYLVAPPASLPAPALVGFHGYAEAAEHELARLNSIPGCEAWLRVAIQALHPFYRGRSTDVVASWMTRQDREHAIDDNRAYVASVVEQVSRDWPTAPLCVCSGFSQGVAMAFRAAVSSPIRPGGVIALGGDVPPELNAHDLRKVARVLLGRGSNDEWYTEEKLEADERRLTAAGVAVQVIRYNGGHEWTTEFAGAAGAFLQSQS